MTVGFALGPLTGGAMNWEGPTYWRAGTIRFLRALEAFDAGTVRQNNIWSAPFPTGPTCRPPSTT